MSPEQIGLDDIDVRADLWAAGIMMFEMLSGRHPVEPLTSTDLVDALSSDAPMVSLRAVAPEVPEALAALVDRCLVKAKANGSRPPTSSRPRSRRCCRGGRHAASPPTNIPTPASSRSRRATPTASSGAAPRSRA